MNNIERLQMKQSVELKQLKAKHTVELQRIKGNVRCCWECNKLFNYTDEEVIRLGDYISCPKCEAEDKDDEEDEEVDEEEYESTTEYARNKPCECGCGYKGGTCETQSKRNEESWESRK